ncbi:hypothetical protein AB0E70_10225 [Streptomyces murinus]|uniref:hypothetical protein n=1 Tax=Streptomyces murinus TaxID=33900 RepID=UPI000A3790D9|nr:hypothetical protein [Streptomyces murinus]
MDRHVAQRRVGEVGLDALVTRYGVVAVLAGPDRGGAYLTQSLLSDPKRIRGRLDEAPTPEAKR